MINENKLFYRKNFRFFFNGLVMMLLSSSIIAQNNSTGLKGKYLGQKPPGMKPEIFAPGIVSTDEYEHSAAVFSPDGKTLLWTVVHFNQPSYLLEMKMENGEWTKPARPSFTDTTADDFYPSFSVDGKKLYFSSRRKLPGGYPQGGDIWIWQVEKNSEGWGSPVPFDTTVSSGNNYAHSVTSDGTIYFSAAGQRGTNWNIYSARKIGNRYQQPEILPYNINAIGYEDGPFIAPDESYLIYESDRADGIEGSIDLYICFREKDGSWSLPENMGEKVNSKFTERFARVSPDGKYLFFGSDRRRTNTSIGADIYWMDAGVIKELRDRHDKKNHIDCRFGVELLLALDNNDHVKASGMLKQWLVIHPNDINAVVHYATALRNNKEYVAAEKILRDKLSRWPDNIYLKTELVLDMYAMGENEEAEKIIPSIIASGVDEKLLYIRVAFSLLSMNNNKTSAACYEKAIRIQGSGPDFYNLACAYAKDNEKEKAINALEKSVELGYGSRHQFESDPDLASLKADERFKKLIEKLK